MLAKKGWKESETVLLNIMCFTRRSDRIHSPGNFRMLKRLHVSKFELLCCLHRQIICGEGSAYHHSPPKAPRTTYAPPFGSWYHVWYHLLAPHTVFNTTFGSSYHVSYHHLAPHTKILTTVGSSYHFEIFEEVEGGMQLADGRRWYAADRASRGADLAAVRTTTAGKKRNSAVYASAKPAKRGRLWTSRTCFCVRKTA